MASVPSIELKRHCRELSAKDTDALVGAVADLIVNFIKTRSEPGATTPGQQAQSATRRPPRPRCSGCGNGEPGGTGS